MEFSVSNYFVYNNLKDKKLIYFSLFVLLFSVVRGLVPLFTNNGNLALPTYRFSYFLGLILSGYGLYATFFKKKFSIKKEIYYLLVINLFLTLYWVSPIIIMDIKSLYISNAANKGLFAFTIFAFIKIPEKKLVILFKIITLIVSFFMFMDFILLNTTLISNGFDIALSRQKTLRPDFSGFGVTGIYMRPTGLFGTSSPHDSANMLAILFVYWLAMLFKNNKGFWSSMSMYVFFSFIALLLSMSASNIVAGFVGMFAVFFVYNKKIFLKKSTLWFGILIIPFFSWLYINNYESIKLLWAFTERLGVKGDWKGLSSYYGNNTWNDLFSLIFGWGSSLDISQAGYYAEQALVKGLFEYGIFHSTVFYIFLLFPVFIYILDRKRLDKFDCFPYIIPIFVGFLSLWHYGSILRTTNIFVFYAIYAQFLRKEIIHRVYR